MANALIFIDVQKDYQSGGKLESKGFEKAAANIAKLLAWAREGHADLFHVQHISDTPDDGPFTRGSQGAEFACGFEPRDKENVFVKSLPSAFSAEGFTQALIDGRYSQVILCGFSSFLCCDSTARDAYHKGYQVIFVEDAIGEFAFDDLTEEELHAYACAVMGLEFATIMKTDDLVR